MKMNKIFRLLTLVVIATMALSAHAQNLKFAHIDSQKLMFELPDFIDARGKLEAEQKSLESQLANMTNELQQKYSEYLTKRDSLPDLIRATKEKELQDTNDRIQNFQQLAQQSLQQKEQQLLAPIMEKLHNAIAAVGKENGFIYIFDLSSQGILYNSDQSVDAEPLVKAKLGVK